MRRGKSTGVLFLLCLLGIAGMKYVEKSSQEIAAVQSITESDLAELTQREEAVTKESQGREEQNIRVLIMGNGYSGEVHDRVSISSESEICIRYGNKQDTVKAGNAFTIQPDDKRFEEGNIIVSSDKKIVLEHLERGYGIPAYEGNVELIATVEGIVIINELSVEKYLQAVVPSEMPASYELEALKAQAVCARTYAYRQMAEYGYPEYEAHVNDSTDYQVYGNVKAQKSTNQAIKDTKGQTVYYQGEMATTYYYSTSCGKTTDMSAWGGQTSEANAYLQSVKVKGKSGDYEKNLPWYRWSAKVPADHLSNLFGLNTGKDVGKIKSIEVTKRGGGEVAAQVKVTGEKGTAVVETENKIRAAFGGEGYQITLNDGTVTESRTLLPSAFFTIEKEGEYFLIKGGGFGHGIGMSQNGANEMAKQGADYKEILRLFYQDIEIH